MHWLELIIHVVLAIIALLRALGFGVLLCVSRMFANLIHA